MVPSVDLRVLLEAIEVTEL